MANDNAPYGLTPIKHKSGCCPVLSDYTIASAYATSIFKGDPVIQLADGSIGIGVGTEGTPTGETLGVFAGCSYTLPGNATQPVWSPYWPANTVATNIVAKVYDDPDIIFSVQSNVTGLTAADVGALIDYKIVAGNTSTGVSASVVDATAGVAATGKQLRILRLVPNVTNAAGAYAKVEVLFIEHAMKGVVSGVGGVA